MRKSTFLGFFIGTLIGFIVGLLIAPKSGRQSREDIIQKKDETTKCIKKKVKNVKYDVQGVTDTIKDTITLYTGSSVKPLEEDNYFEKEY